MGRVLAAVLVVAMLVLAGCTGGPSANAPERGEKENVEKAAGENEPPKPSKPEVPADVPAYSTTKDQQITVQGLRVRDVAASTDATSEEDLEAITRELWAETKTEVLIATFFPNKPMAETSGVGQAFANEQAASTFIASQYTDPSEANIEGQVREAMANDGLLVISIQDEVDSINQSVRAEWDVTTMGTPPPEMNCPGY